MYVRRSLWQHELRRHLPPKGQANAPAVLCPGCGRLFVFRAEGLLGFRGRFRGTYLLILRSPLLLCCFDMWLLEPGGARSCW